MTTPDGSPERIPTDDDIRAAIRLAEAQVLADIRSGRVPSTVTTFAELHDYVDANEYGGLCQPGPFWQAGDSDDRPDTFDARMTAAGAVQDAVDGWLRRRANACPSCAHPAHTTSRYGGGGCNAMTSTGWTTYGCHCDAGPRPL